MATAHRLGPGDDASRIAELEARLARLEKINSALIDRVERSSDLQGSAFSMFETAISLEAIVRSRTAELEVAMAGLASAHHDADAARARLRDAIESLSDGFALFDADDHLIMCNRAYVDFWPEALDGSDPAPSFADVAGRIAQSGRSVGSLVSPQRWLADRIALHRGADGAHVQALSDGRWVQINELRTSEGGTVGIYTDITEVKAEDARQRARELAERNLALQTTLDSLSEGVCIYDSQQRLLAINGALARMLGEGTDLRETIASHHGLVQACNAIGLGDAAAISWRSQPGHRSETPFSFRDRRFIVRSTALQTGGMVFGFDDVTDRELYQESLRETAETLERRVAERTTELESEVAERRIVEAQLIAAKTAAEHANRSKTSFIAAASHDLLQPLNAARLFVAALGERRLALPTRALVRQAGVALDSVEDLLEALFEISRLDAGAIQPEITPINLGRIVAALRIEFGPLARSRGLALEMPDTDLWISSDLRLLRRILQNFLSNALRYTRAGTVGLDVQDLGDTVRLTVRDTGPGIAAADQDLIFEEFRRLDTGQKIAGKGLGLSIVRRAGLMLGHEIRLESHVGAGSAFSIELPKCAAVPQQADDAGGGPMRRPSHQNRVLIVDNDEAILAGMSALLTKWGYEVVVTGSGQSSTARSAIAGGIDLIIADYHLHGDERGDAAVRDLRGLAGAEIPAIIITADRSEEVKARLAAASLPVLTKPVKPAQLRALLRTIAA